MIQLSELLRGVGQRAAESLDNTWRPEEAGARAQRENTTSGGVFGDWAQERYGDVNSQAMASIPENPYPTERFDPGSYFSSIPGAVGDIAGSLWQTPKPSTFSGVPDLWDTGRTPKVWGPEPAKPTAAAVGSFGFGNGANYGAASGNDNVANFMNRLRPAAQRVSAETGIPYEVLMAIPANETGWGSAIAGNNLYGIKGTSKSGKNTGAVGTWEVVDGQRVNINDTFRAYDSDEESMRDFASFLKENPRYGDALQQFQQTGDADALVRNIGAAGYATDPEWGNKITSIMGTVRSRDQAVTPTTNPGGNIANGGWEFAGWDGPETSNYQQAYGAAQWAGGPPAHRGVDIRLKSAPNNGMGQSYTPFVSGTVVQAGDMGAGGTGLLIRDDQGLYHWYFHNQQNLVQPGDRVQAGVTPIGVVGQTGSEGFPHLHYEVSRNTEGGPGRQNLDPTQFMRR